MTARLATCAVRLRWRKIDCDGHIPSPRHNLTVTLLPPDIFEVVAVPPASNSAPAPAPALASGTPAAYATASAAQAASTAQLAAPAGDAAPTPTGVAAAPASSSPADATPAASATAAPTAAVPTCVLAYLVGGTAEDGLCDEFFALRVTAEAAAPLPAELANLTVEQREYLLTAAATAGASGSGAAARPRSKTMSVPAQAAAPTAATATTGVATGAAEDAGPANTRARSSSTAPARRPGMVVAPTPHELARATADLPPPAMPNKPAAAAIGAALAELVSDALVPPGAPVAAAPSPASSSPSASSPTTHSSQSAATASPATAALVPTTAPAAAPLAGVGRTRQRPRWLDDSEVSVCQQCGKGFGVFIRKVCAPLDHQ